MHIFVNMRSSLNDRAFLRNLLVPYNGIRNARIANKVLSHLFVFEDAKEVHDAEQTNHTSGFTEKRYINQLLIFEPEVFIWNCQREKYVQEIIHPQQSL